MIKYKNKNNNTRTDDNGWEYGDNKKVELL